MDNVCGPFEVRVDRRLEARLARQSVEKKGSLVYLFPNPLDKNQNSSKKHSPESNVINFPKRITENSKTLIYRNFDCPNYEGCLSLCATLNWDSFTCENCPGLINRNLMLKAHQKRKACTEFFPLYKLPSKAKTTNG